MPTSQVPNLQTRQHVPAMLKHNGIGWFIEYYSQNPQTEEMVRFRLKLNRERKRYARVADFRQYAATVANEINIKLFGGWSPFFASSENSRLYTPLSVVMAEYLSEKERELRAATLTSYKSFCKMFGDWTKEKMPNILMAMFNRVMAVRYLDYVYNERKVSARTWNNQLKMARAFFNWAKEKCYINENPFEAIKPKREQEKRRILIPADYRQQITDYLATENPAFLTVCRLVFVSLIRPKEICNIQIKHVRLATRAILIPQENAKNHHTRFAAFNSQILDDLLTMRLDQFPDDYFLFGDGYRPAKKRITPNRFRKDWDKMRKALKLPSEMQLYSLRDTGINNLLKAGVDPLTVMQHADHHDLSMTTRYANHQDENLTRTIFERGVDF